MKLQERIAARHPGLRISAEPTERDSHARDWWPRAGKWNSSERAAHRPAAVAFPANEQDCISLVTACGEGGTKLVPYGAGSGVVGAIVSTGEALVVDMGGMNQVAAFDPENGSVTVEPGMKGGALEAWLNERGFTLGHYPQSLHLASIGGLVSTRSTGTFSNKYGGIEDLVLGLRVVGSDGEVTAIRNVPRSSAGPSLQQLFIGAEGIFGLITQVTLRVFPQAEARLFEGYQFPTVAAGIEAVRKAYAAHLRPAVLRLYDETEAAGLYRRVGSEGGPPLLIAGFEGLSTIAAAEQAAFAKIATASGGVSIGAPIGEAWEAHRFDASWLTRGNEGPAHLADAIEVALPWTALAQAHAAIVAEVGAHASVVMGHYSHFYSTGACLYVIVLIEGTDTVDALARYDRVWEAVTRRTVAFGGSVAHHHGVGRQRAPLMAQELEGSRALLQRIKSALDPQNLFCPGNLGLDGGRHESR